MKNTKLLSLSVAAGLAVMACTAFAASTGIDTSPGVNTLPFSIGGTNYMTLDATTPAAPMLTVNGSVYANGYFHNSDMRLKTNIHTASGLAVIEGLRGVTFDWKQGGQPSAGILAQDVEKVMPSAVRVNSAGYKTVEYDQLMGPMIEAIKELKTQNDRQAAEIEDLRKQIGK